MDNKSSAPLVDVEMTAIDAATISVGINTATINTSRKTDELLDALKNNRKRLQTLKNDYVAAVKSDGGVPSKPSGKRRMVYHEIFRIYGAMEALKNELTQRGAVFETDPNDHEHPNAAFKRLTAPKKPEPSDAVFWWIIISLILFFSLLLAFM